MNGEFEQEEQSPPQDGLNRLEASARNISLEPLSSDVKPEERSDEYVANHDVLNGPIANLSIDSEQTTTNSSQNTPLKENGAPYAFFFIIGGIIIAVLAGVFVLFFFVIPAPWVVVFLVLNMRFICGVWLEHSSFLSWSTYIFQLKTLLKAGFLVQISLSKTIWL